MRRQLITLLLVLAAATHPVSLVRRARAQAPAGPSTDARAQDEAADAQQAHLLAEIAHLEREASSNARARLETLLAEGQADAVTDRAIAALGTLAAPKSLPVLSALRRHRRPKARQAAYAALARIAGPETSQLLEAGLRDPDPGVRAQAALALGEAGGPASLDALFLALSRGVSEAAIAIGRVGDADSIARYRELLGREPLAVMLSGYREFLARVDLEERAQLEIVASLEDLASPVAASFLRGLLQDDVLRKPALVRAAKAAVARLQARAPAEEAKTVTAP